jgi:hypothetical protein
MRSPMYVGLGVAVLLCGSAYARPGWTDPVKGMSLLCRFLDPHYIRTPCKASGKLDDRNKWRQHLGTDFSAGKNATVLSPVKGKVVIFDAHTSKPAGEAFLVIRDTQTNEEHVIGHISSTLGVGSLVNKGDAIGKVRDQGTATHVHWGFNIGSVQKAMQKRTWCLRDKIMQDCKWGWGMAPYEAVEREVREQGWRNVL